MRAYERLIRYAQIWTTSQGDSETTPSTQRQFNLAYELVNEMKNLGLVNVHTDDRCYVYGMIPASEGYEDAVSLGFISHLDTSPDASGENVKPQVYENYDGGPLTLPSGRVLSPEMFPHLPSLKGRTLITSDGSTLLGADDKAGIAEILTAAEIILKEDLPHGKICIAFTPDEEIGRGAEELSIPDFGAQYAYTVDGGPENEINYENFNASAASFQITGFSVHPGNAKDTMINAALIACEINSMLPAMETPSHTEGREGFYHLTSISGNVESAHADYIVRDHDEDSYHSRLAALRHIEKCLNEKYGEGTVSLTIKEQYRNMIEKIRPCMHLIDNVKEVMKELGLTPDTQPVRGGTDGAQLSFRGLPCPNLGTGGYAFHGPCEHITAEGMDIAVKVILGIISRYAG